MPTYAPASTLLNGGLRRRARAQSAHSVMA